MHFNMRTSTLPLLPSDLNLVTTYLKYRSCDDDVCIMNKPFEEFSGVHVSGNLVAGTPDTISETGSMKSRSRRTLPYLPPEEPAPLPTQAKKAQERMRYTYTL